MFITLMKAKHALVHWHDYQHVAKSNSGPIIYNQLSVCNLILEFITPSDKLLNAANSNSVFFNCIYMRSLLLNNGAL